MRSLNDRTAGPRPGEGTVYSPKKYRETEGIKDYKNVNLGTWRPATDGEINTGQLPTGASLRQVITVGGDREQRILTAPSKAGSVTHTGNPTIYENADGSTSYTFPAGGPGTMHVKSTAGSTVFEDKDYSTEYTVTYKVSGYDGSLSGIVCKRDSNGRYSPVGDPTYRTWYYGYRKSTLSVTGVDTGSGSAKITFTPKAPNQGGGTVVVTPYTPEKTKSQKYGYFVYIPASAEEESRVFLVQEAAQQAQNFAFDGMDDWEENYS